MSLLPILLELQGVHDNLKTIERDLSAFPPDMARLDGELKTLARKSVELEKVLTDSKNQAQNLTKDLAEAQVLEEHARKSVKSASSKVQYTAAIRELDTRERQTASIQKPLKELQLRIQRTESELAEVAARREEAQAQFDSLHEIFLSEHENQVAARTLLASRRVELETALPSPDLTKFNRLLTARQGQALAEVAAGACMGCRTKLRIPLMSELRDKGLVFCESCQRYLYIANK